MLQQFGAAQINFGNNLIAAETGLNQNVLGSETAWETSAFGNYSALNGGLDGAINAGNLVPGRPASRRRHALLAGSRCRRQAPVPVGSAVRR